MREETRLGRLHSFLKATVIAGVSYHRLMILEHGEDMIVTVAVGLGSDERMQSFTIDTAPMLQLIRFLLHLAIIRIIILFVDGRDELGLSV